MSYHITPASALDLRPVTQPGTSGLADCTMLSAAHGSVHTEVAISELAQAPAPPPSGAFFFEDDWKRLEPAPEREEG